MYKWIFVCNKVSLGSCMADTYEQANEMFKKELRYIDWSEGQPIRVKQFIYLDAQSKECSIVDALYEALPYVQRSVHIETCHSEGRV